MNENRFRTVVIAALLVLAGVALVVLAAIGTDVAVEIAKRIEGAFVLLVPALVHSLAVTTRDEAQGTETIVGEHVIAEQANGERPRRGVVREVVTRYDGVYLVVEHTEDGANGRIGLWEYHEDEVRRVTEREPTGGHRV